MGANGLTISNDLSSDRGCSADATELLALMAAIAESSRRLTLNIDGGSEIFVKFLEAAADARLMVRV